MREIIKDEQKIIKDGDNVMYSNEFIVKLDDDSINKNMIYLHNNLKTLKSLLNQDIIKQVNKKADELHLQLKIAKEALKNYDTYEKELMDEIIKDRDNRIKQFQMFVDNFDKILENSTKKLEFQLKQQATMYKTQYDVESKQLQIYLDAGYTVEDEKDATNEVAETTKTD